LGLQRDPANPDGSVFNATTFALTYKLAEYLIHHDLSGLGNGVVGVRYSDDPQLRGDYTIYVQLDRVTTEIPDGSVIAQAPDPGVYVIWGRAKFWIPNPAVLQAYYGGWPSVRVLAPGTLEKNDIGDAPVDGTILREVTAPAVWRMQAGMKCWIVSPTVLAHYGGWPAVRLVPDQAMVRFPQGPDVTA
jgi:hypothetical protein